NGYAVADKQSCQIDLEGCREGDQDIRQIRWVVKAGDLDDAAASIETPVPHGFRLDVDAVPFDGTNDETVAATTGDQEADDLDPARVNIGWEWQKDEPGEDPDGDGSIYRYDDAGRKLLVSEAPMPDSVKNNGLLVVCQTYLLEDLHALSDRPLYDAKLSGGEVVP